MDDYYGLFKYANRFDYPSPSGVDVSNFQGMSIYPPGASSTLPGPRASAPNFSLVTTTPSGFGTSVGAPQSHGPMPGVQYNLEPIQSVSPKRKRKRVSHQRTSASKDLAAEAVDAAQVAASAPSGDAAKTLAAEAIDTASDAKIPRRFPGGRWGKAALGTVLVGGTLAGGNAIKNQMGAMNSGPPPARPRDNYGRY